MNAVRNRPILVTGTIRSGTTWVGQMIASHPKAIYLWEPFNYEYRANDAPLQCWFQHVTADQEEQFHRYLRPCFEFHHSWLQDFRQRIHPRRFVGATLRKAQAWWRRVAGYRAVMKDPTALFSAEWLARTYAMDVVVLIRHPAAFVSSLKRLNWRFIFADFLKQPELINGLLRPFTDELLAYSQNQRSLIDESILLWRLGHHVIRHYQQRHPDWTFIRHEDISQRPVEEFEQLFQRIGLRMTTDVRRTIESHSSEANPHEAGEKVIHQLKRNSKENIWNWRERLTPDEIGHIRAATADLAPYWYSDADWGEMPARLSA